MIYEKPIECKTIEEKIDVIWELRNLGFETSSYITKDGKNTKFIKNDKFLFVCPKKDKSVSCSYSIPNEELISYDNFKKSLNCDSFFGIQTS